MANSKISVLTSATTPLAGTETLPVVQSSTTKQVSVSNLTAGRAVSAASLTLTTTPLPVASGGTGLISFTLNGVPYANTTTTLTTSSGLTFNGTNFVAGIFSVDSATATIATTGIAGVRNVFDMSATGNGGAGRGTSFRILAPGSVSAVAVARIVGYQTTASATANNAALTIEVANSSGTLTEYLKINNAGDVTVNTGNALVIGAGGLGYGTGSGGTVTQATSRTTGVTLNKTNGAITLVSAAGLATFQSFTVTNSTVAATDVVHVTQKSGTDLYQIFVTATAAGSFRITFATTGGITVEQPVFNFAVIKAVTA